jgi:hypothetical protein
MKRGDVILFKNNDYFGKLITKFTGGKYSHSAIYWGGGNILEVSPLYLKVIPLSKKKNKDVDVYRPEKSDDKIEYGLKLIHKRLKQSKWYGVFNALFFVILKVFKLYKLRPVFRMFEGNNGVICSEVTSNYLEILKLKKWKWNCIPNSLISPSDIPKAFYISKVK